MSFGKNVTATKIELIKIRRSLQVSSMVHKILDDKREVLLKKIDEMIEEANKTRGDIWSPLSDIYSAVYDSYMSLGTSTLESISDSTPAIMEVNVNVRRIVDVKIRGFLPGGLSNTCPQALVVPASGAPQGQVSDNPSPEEPVTATTTGQSRGDRSWAVMRDEV